MIYRVISYISFLLKSTNQHGVHSPFVYKLVTECFYKKTKKEKEHLFLKVKKQLINNSNLIKVRDLGAGSKVFKNDRRKIKDIAKHAGLPNKRANLLIRVSQYFKPNFVLELGTSLGLSSSAIYIGNPTTNITTLEGCSNTAEVAKKQFNTFNFNTINVVVEDFENSLSNIKNTFDLIYFDGNHQKEATIKYFKSCLNYIHNDSVFIFDDIHWSKQMSEAWNEIKKHSKTKVTIDTYQWGFVFFRKEQEKEHFTIRI